VDLLNLKRLVPESRLSFISPGLKPAEFCFDANARNDLRAQWKVGDDPVVPAVSFFAPVTTCGW
jgi:hypothetical protein